MTSRLFARPDLADPVAQRGLRSDATVTGASLTLQGGLRLTFLVLAARLVGPSEYSKLGAALAIGTLAAILGPASLGSALSKYVGRRADGDARPATADGAAEHILRRFHVIAPVVSAAAGLIVALMTDWSMTAPAAVLAFGLSAQALGRGVHMSLGMSRREGALQALAGVAAVLVLGGLAFFAEVSAGSACLVLGGALVVYLVLTYPRGAHRHHLPKRPLSRELDAFVAIAVLGSIASAGLVQLCVAAGQLRLSPQEAGLLAAAASLATPLALAASAVGLVAYPRMARLALSLDDGHLRNLRNRLSRLLGCFGAIAVMGAALADDLVVQWVLGAGYAGSAASLGPLVTGIAFTSIASASASALSATHNRALAIVSGSAWVGLLLALTLWSVLPATGEWIARAFAVACWVSGTMITLAADHMLGARFTWRWLSLSIGLWLLGAGTIDPVITTVGGASLVLFGLAGRVSTASASSGQGR